MTQSVLFFYRLFVVLGIGIYTSLKAFSRGIRLDEGKIDKALILSSSPLLSPAGEGFKQLQIISLF